MHMNFFIMESTTSSCSSLSSDIKLVIIVWHVCANIYLSLAL